MSFEEGRKRFVVAGRVQGVGYRAFAARAARGLRLKGGAANLDDGRVLVVAAGPRYALDRLEALLWEGPRLARVDTVASEELSEGPAAGAGDPGFDVEF